MRKITLEELLEAGCHFGHQTNRWHPNAQDYIYDARGHIHIIDLAETKKGLEKAGQFVKELGAQNQALIFVGTKNQARKIVREAVETTRKKTGENGQIYYVNERWIGGAITNYEEIAKNFKKLSDLQKKIEETKIYTKKERSDFAKDILKIQRFYQGLLGLSAPPQAVFIIDLAREKTALAEARRKNVTIIAIADTNTDPSLVDYPIPSNDDSIGAITLITEYLAEAYAEGAGKQKATTQGSTDL